MLHKNALFGSFNTSNNRSPTISIRNIDNNLSWEFGGLSAVNTQKTVSRGSWHQAIISYQKTDANNHYVTVYLDINKTFLWQMINIDILETYLCKTRI